MDRESFLNIKIPIMPYCNIHRGPSTGYNESFHIFNSNTKKQINIFYRCDGEIAVTLFDAKEKNPYNTHKEVFRDKKFTNKKLNEICSLHLA